MTTAYTALAKRHAVKSNEICRNKCISGGLMHVATWHRRSPESKFTKLGEDMSIGQTPNRTKFCSDPTRSVQNICDQKFVLPEKVVSNSSATPKVSHHAKFHWEWWNHLEEKRYKIFYTLQYFGLLRRPLGPKVTSLGGGVHLVVDVTHKKTPSKTYSKRYVSTLHAVTIRVIWGIMGHPRSSAT